MLQTPADVLALPLLLLLVVQAPPPTGARPSPGPDYLQRGWLRLLAEGEGCAPCQPEECATPRGCLAGRVRDPCDCCWECANIEGQLCDLDPSAHFYGRCGEQLECRLDTGGDLSRGEVPEPLCACRSQRPLCGSDGRTYAQICRLQEAARARPDANLTVAHPGPCESGCSCPTREVPGKLTRNDPGLEVGEALSPPSPTSPTTSGILSSLLKMNTLPSTSEPEIRNQDPTGTGRVKQHQTLSSRGSQGLAILLPTFG
ncbi:Kazal type serine peptidase inhibitor domain 1 [Rhinolophus ferrumequinum]|uniref:Kazal type serine peptidase inhibitor domain 1 n=1 Tax=Rhinolophus ferrumequinum TaxID=59479 RepID=A0A7J7UWP8_RHIFE|nr:Kazal type serine peptidase inhibitor domain 1 [Rhinolophus ferrumequinum]